MNKTKDSYLLSDANTHTHIHMHTHRVKVLVGCY